jgi:hypothetical protein
MPRFQERSRWAGLPYWALIHVYLHLEHYTEPGHVAYLGLGFQLAIG